MSKQKGVIQVDKFPYLDKEYVVKLDKQTSMFFIEGVAGSSLRGKDIEALKNNAIATIRRHLEKTREWEPVIIISPGFTYRVNEFPPFKFYRYFKAEGEEKDRPLWRKFKPVPRKKKGHIPIADYVVVGEPGDPMPPPIMRKARMIKYTPARWLALVHLQEACQDFMDTCKKVFLYGDTANVVQAVDNLTETDIDTIVVAKRLTAKKKKEK
jgi:hypothetical protein